MKIKRAVFLSHPINEEMPVYGGGEGIALKKIKSIKNGDSCNKMFWSFPNHIGTHIDMPLHFVEEGRSVSELSPIDLIFSRIELVEPDNMRPGHAIDKDDLKDIRDCDLLLIKARHSHRDKGLYGENSVSLSPELAPWLKERCPSLRAIGIDSLSLSNINDREAGRKAHRAFLSRDLLLIEYMKLEDLESEPDIVIVAPVRVEKADGSPCTVLGIYN